MKSVEEGEQREKVGLLSTRRKTCDQSTSQSRAMSAGAPALIFRYKGARPETSGVRLPCQNAEHCSR